MLLYSLSELLELSSYLSQTKSQSDLVTSSPFKLDVPKNGMRDIGKKSNGVLDPRISLRGEPKIGLTP